MTKNILGTLLAVMLVASTAFANGDQATTSREIQVKMVQDQIAITRGQLNRLRKDLTAESNMEMAGRMAQSAAYAGEVFGSIVILIEGIEKGRMAALKKFKYLAAVATLHATYMNLGADRTDGKDEAILKERKAKLEQTLLDLESELVKLKIQ